jgi:transposase-like protein
VAAITEELCGVTFSKSTVSALCEGLTERVDLWNERSLHGQSFPFLIVDAIVIKVRRDHVVRPTGALIVCGVDEDGVRQILGVRFGDSESEATWEQTFNWLKNRGLRGVDFVVSDAHRGLTNAVSKHFQGAVWQRCQVHFARNVLGHIPRHLKDQVSRELNLMFRSPDKETARKQLAEMMDRYSKIKGMRFVLPVLEEGFEDAVAVLDLPETLQTRLRTTNMVERLNEEIRRRERVIRIFPNEESAHRLLGSVLAEIHEKWASAYRYLCIDDYYKYKERLRHARPATKLRLVLRAKQMVPTLVQ